MNVVLVMLTLLTVVMVGGTIVLYIGALLTDNAPEYAKQVRLLVDSFSGLFTLIVLLAAVSLGWLWTHRS